MGTDSHFEVEADLRRYEALLGMADVVARHPTLEELFRELARLRDAALFEVAGFSLFDSTKNVMQLQVWEGGELPRTPTELPIEDTATGWVWRNQEPLSLPDVQSESRFQPCLNILKEKGIRSFCVLPLTTGSRRWGALGLGSLRADAYSEKDMRLFRWIAELVALATERALARRGSEQHSEHLQMLGEISALLAASPDVAENFAAISAALRKIFRQDMASLSLLEAGGRFLRVSAVDFPANPEVLPPGKVMPLENTCSAEAIAEQQPKVLDRQRLQSMETPLAEKFIERGIRSICCLPLLAPDRVIGSLTLASMEGNAFQPDDVGWLQQVAGQLAQALDNAFAHREIGRLRDKLAQESILNPDDEARPRSNFVEIIGESPVLKRALAHAQTVAPSDSTVLILGETGTGKELMARAIHRMSGRRDANFIKLNCAAIPTGLLESELFGHEKGAFTGAISQKIGRLELAHHGTILLDEVGDIALELQPKLLRVLQDKEFERLGSNRTLRVDVRMIAATNRDLAKSVAEHEFRIDLYYRLNVFPIHMPALRERVKDIPLLVRYFVQKFSQRMNRTIETIPSEAMRALQKWDWPGNVRELENFIERSLILTTGPVLNVPMIELRPSRNEYQRDSSLEGMEREQIVRTLRETGGVISGLDGAAARLGLKRTTLQSKIQKMQIARLEYEN